MLEKIRASQNRKCIRTYYWNSGVTLKYFYVYPIHFLYLCDLLRADITPCPSHSKLNKTYTLTKPKLTTPWVTVPLCRDDRHSIQHILIFQVTWRNIVGESNFYFICVKDCKLCYMLEDNVDNFYVLFTAKDLSVSAAGANGLKLNVLHDCSM